MNHLGLSAFFTTADKILFLICFALIVFSYVHFWQSSVARYAIVKSPQQDPLFIELSHSGIHQVQGSLGISKLEIKNNQIRFTASACKNKLCIQSGWHQHGGAVTACLPNRISVQLSSQNTTSNYDAIIF